MARIICLFLVGFNGLVANAQLHQPGVQLPDESDLLNIAPAFSRVIQAEQEQCAPEIVDLSALMPPVGNQKLQCSCVAWALGYGCRTYYNSNGKASYFKPDKSIDYSKIVSPSFIYNLLNNGDASKGIKMEDALRLMIDTGSCTFRSMPYDEFQWTKLPGKPQIEEAMDFRIDTFCVLVPSPYLVSEIKGQLRAKQPVVVSAFYDHDFFKDGYNYEGQYYRWDTFHKFNATLGHAILIVGYDDFIEAFKFMNSQGTTWGNKGFGWLPYNIAPDAIKAAYVIKPKRNLKEVAHNECQSEEAIHPETAMKPSTKQVAQHPVKGQTKARASNARRSGALKATNVVSKQNKLVQPVVLANTKYKDVAGRPRENKFEVKMAVLKQPDSSRCDISLSIDLTDCACDSYQVAVHFFFADIHDNTKKGAPVKSYYGPYSLANGQAAIICRREEFTGSVNEWKRISIPLNELAIPKGMNTSRGYVPAKTKLIAEAVWYNDDFPIRSCGTLAFDLDY